jgi:F-type H+-transporting ATPase subunit alpha
LRAQTVIDRGRKNNILLVQPQYSPMPVAEQIAILYCGTRNLLRTLPLESVAEFEQMFLDIIKMRHKEDVLDVLASGALTDKVSEIIESVAAEVVGSLTK